MKIEKAGMIKRIEGRTTQLQAELHTATSIIFGVRTKLTFQEFCQILAALRHWQLTYKRTAPAIIKADWDEHFEDCEPMTMQQIDELCESITFA